MRRRSFLMGAGGSLAMGMAFNSDMALGAPAASAVVATSGGDVQGTLEAGIHVFRGIPFAAAPFGALRLQPPAVRDPWEGILPATAFGPKPPQGPYPPMVTAMLPELVGPGEDCLTLNVWTPSPGTTSLPVMVWIPGGMFEYHGTGASPLYDGSHFARDGVVCVTINYRVGPDGFLFLDDGIANLGLLDQIAALEWVRDNIAAFGGDPAKVTVFGESAGALSIGTLLAMPRAKGLFRRAVLESGGAHHVTSAQTAGRIGRRLAEKLGVPATRDAIAATTIEQTIAAAGALRGELAQNPDPAFWAEVMLTSLPWAPVVDGALITARPYDLIVAGAGAEVDLLVGTNTEENRLFLVPGGVIDQIPAAAVAGLVAGYGLSPDRALPAYTALHPGAGPGDLLAAIQTDWYWRLPAMRLADAHAAIPASAPTYMYEFVWRSPLFEGRLGAGHSLEIGFVFDTLGSATEGVAGPNPPQALADTMHRAWVEFATTGDPGWAGYDPARRATMHFDVESRLVEDPLAAERALWDPVR